MFVRARINLGYIRTFIVLSFTSVLVKQATGENVTTVLEFQPPSPVSLFEEDVQLINITYNATDANGVDSIFVKIELLEDDHLERVKLLSVNRTMEFRFEEGEWLCLDNCSVEVEAVFLGEAELRFHFCQGTSEQCSRKERFRILVDRYHIYVSRHQRFLDTVFTVVIVLFGCIVNFGMGCKIDLGVVIDSLKRPVAPAVGFLCQFLLMPPLAFGYTKALQLSGAESVGLFANGCSPGGGASNMWTLLFHGDVSLSVTMTAVSTFASLAMFPFWMFTLGRYIIGSDFRIAFENIVLSLVGIVIPSIIGIVMQRIRPKFAKIVAKSLRPVMFILLIFMFTVGVYINLFMFRLFTTRLLLAACFLPTSGFTCGLIVSFLTRRKKSHIIAIALETGIQNTGVAIMTLRLSLPQPQNDLSIVGAVCPSLFTAPPLLLFYFIYAVYSKCTQRDDQKSKDVIECAEPLEPLNERTNQTT